MDLPPVATTSEAAVACDPSDRLTVNPSPLLARRSTPAFIFRVTPAAAMSSVSIRTICLALSSQNSWPSVFSCQAIPALSMRLMKSCWV